jgi:hypothetical protein
MSQAPPMGDLPALDEHVAPAEQAVVEARLRAELFASTWGSAYLGAVACVTEGFEELAAHLHFPRAHWPRIRHTNLSGPSARSADRSRSSAGSRVSGPPCHC